MEVRGVIAVVECGRVGANGVAGEAEAVEVRGVSGEEDAVEIRGVSGEDDAVEEVRAVGVRGGAEIVDADSCGIVDAVSVRITRDSCGWGLWTRCPHESRVICAGEGGDCGRGSGGWGILEGGRRLVSILGRVLFSA